jgi:hypothetical protein
MIKSVTMKLHGLSVSVIPLTQIPSTSTLSDITSKFHTIDMFVSFSAQNKIKNHPNLVRIFAIYLLCLYVVTHSLCNQMEM